MMISASLMVGQHLILNSLHCEILRILENDIVQLECKNDFKLINRSKSELLLEHEQGMLKFAKYDGTELAASGATKYELRDLSAYSEEQQTAARLRMDYIRLVTQKLGSIPQYVGLDRVIIFAAGTLKDEEPPSPITLYRWWQRWENSLHDITSLVPRTPSKGVGSRLPKPILNILNEIVKDDVLQRESTTTQDVYDRLKYMVNSHNKSTSRPLKVPGRMTIYRYINNLDRYDVLLAKKGKRAAKKEFRVSGQGIYPDYILERTEIDHTPLDLIIVDDKTFLPIGRPNLTCIIDKASRAILGFSLSFEPPSELSVIRALRKALYTKINLKNSCADLENEWLAHGIPMCIVVDNGLEFHSKMLRQLCYELNIELVFCPKKEPQFKGCIERMLGTINRSVSHECGGTTFSNITERGDYDSIEQARVTLKEANELITQWIVDVYHQRRHSITGHTPDYLWKEGLTKVQPRLPGSVEAFELASARPYQGRRLAHDGIRFKYLNYNSTELLSIRRHPMFTGVVDVRINHENLGFVWVYDKPNDRYIKVECTNFEYADGLTLLQHEEVLKEKRLKSDEEYNEEKYLEGKEKLRKKIKAMNSDKLLKERKKAARIEMAKMKSEAIEADIEALTRSPVSDFLVDLDDIPEFQSHQF